MPSFPEVTVIIPFDPEHTPPEMLAEAKKSVKRQDIQTTIIVVKDGSNPAAARNIGLDRTESRYVAFLDADDLWLPGKLTTQLTQMEQTGAGLCLEGESMTRDDFFYTVLLGTNDDIMSSVVIDTNQVETRFEEQLDRWEDHLFALEAASTGVCFCQETFIHREHANSLTAEKEGTHLGVHPYYYLEQGKLYASLLFNRVPEARPFIHSFYRDLYFKAGYHFYRRGQYRTAQVYLKRSIQIGPRPKPLIGFAVTLAYQIFESVLSTKSENKDFNSDDR